MATYSAEAKAYFAVARPLAAKAELLATEGREPQGFLAKKGKIAGPRKEFDNYGPAGVLAGRIHALTGAATRIVRRWRIMPQQTRFRREIPIH